jgi:hypothetical protein
MHGELLSEHRPRVGDMCEVWKWLAIGTGVPMFLYVVYVWPSILWLMPWWEPRRLTERSLRKVQRAADRGLFQLWCLGTLVFAFSLTIYVAHCT